MKLSEVIEKLVEVQKKYGDELPVVLNEDSDPEEIVTAVIVTGYQDPDDGQMCVLLSV